MAVESVAMSQGQPPEMRLLGGLLLWVLVCVLLAVPLWIVVRAVARRRVASMARRAESTELEDAWRESGRRMGERP